MTRTIPGSPPGPTTRRRVGSVMRLRSAASTVLVVLLMLSCLASLLLAGWDTPVFAAPPGPHPVAAPASLEQVVNNIRTWLFGLLVAVATLFLTVGGVRLMWAGGDPSEAEKGKAALKSAAIGYALALLAPLIVTIVAGWVS